MSNSTASFTWDIIYQQQWLDRIPCKGAAAKNLRDAVVRFIGQLAAGIRSNDMCREALRLSWRVLRRGHVHDGVFLLWTTDFSYAHEADMYEEVVQIWCLCEPTHERQVVTQLQRLWNERSLRREGSLLRVVREVGKRKTTALPGGQWREEPRRIECHEDLEMAWLAKFVHFPQDLHDQWVSGGDIQWDRLPLVCTLEQQRHVRAPGPMILVGRAGSGKTVVLRERLWFHYVDAQKNHQNLRQVFLTLSPQLANSAAEQFIEAQTRHFPQATPPVLEKHLDLTRGLAALPQAPCFLSLRGFTKLLSSWLRVKCFHSWTVESEFEGLAPSSPRPDLQMAVEVTFRGFCKWFWPKQERKMQELDALLVWSEIQSFLKGRTDVYSNAHGFALTREQYLTEVGKRQAVGLTEKQNDIYTIFEEYTKWSRNNNCFDRMDIAQKLLHELVGSGEAPWIDHLYVDEVQDLALAEVELCLRCLRGLQGVAFGGDTTQTVSQGISFRFHDLDRAIQESAKRRRIASFLSNPWLELTFNHRSHVGIVEFSNFLVHLMDELFPWTLDQLSPARSLLKGHQPIIVNAKDVPIVDLGAHQIFLVVSPSVELPDGWRGPVATPAAVKGLEFTDVILMSWWSNTPNSCLWDQLLAIGEQLLDSWHSTEKSIKKARKAWQVPERMPLSKELKQLFVGVTRPQHGLVICEEENHLARRLHDFLTRAGILAKDNEVLKGLLKRSAEQCTAADFEQRGDIYFQKGLIDLANYMWTRAGELLEAAGNLDAARIQYLRAEQWEKATRCVLHCSLPSSDQQDLVSSYAANFGRKYATFPKWAKDIFDSRQWWAAALHVASVSGDIGLQGEYLEKLGSFERAGEAFDKCSRWEDAARCYNVSGLWWRALSLADRVPAIEFEVANSLCRNQNQDLGKLMQSFLQQPPAQINANMPSSINLFAQAAKLPVTDRNSMLKVMDSLERGDPGTLLAGCGLTAIELHMIAILTERLPQSLLEHAAIIIPGSVAVVFPDARPLSLWPTKMWCVQKDRFHAKLCSRFAPAILASLQEFPLHAKWAKQHETTVEVTLWCARHLTSAASATSCVIKSLDETWPTHTKESVEKHLILVCGREEKMLRWAKEILDSHHWWIQGLAVASAAKDMLEQGRYLEKLDRFEEAARFFKNVEKWKDSARCYKKAGQLWNALQMSDRVPAIEPEVAELFSSSSDSKDQELGRAMQKFLQKGCAQDVNASSGTAAAMQRILLDKTHEPPTTASNPSEGQLDAKMLLSVVTALKEGDLELLIEGCGASQADLELLRALRAHRRTMTAKQKSTHLILPRKLAKLFAGAAPLISWPNQMFMLEISHFTSQVGHLLEYAIAEVLQKVELPDTWSDQHDANMEVLLWCSARIGLQHRVKFDLPGKSAHGLNLSKHGDRFRVQKISGGLVEKWNGQNPMQMIKHGDYIIEVNEAKTSLQEQLKGTVTCLTFERGIMRVFDRMFVGFKHARDSFLKYSIAATRAESKFPQWAQPVFEAHSLWNEAVQVAEVCNCIDLKRQYLLKAGRFKEAADCILEAKLPADKRRELFSKCVIESSRADGAIPKWAKEVFDSQQWWREAAQVAKSSGETELQGNYLQRLGILDEAAECYAQMGKFEEALKCGLQSKKMRQRKFIGKCAVGWAKADKIFPKWVQDVLEQNEWWNEALEAAEFSDNVSLKASLLEKAERFEELARFVIKHELRPAQDQPAFVSGLVIKSVEQKKGIGWAIDLFKRHEWLTQAESLADELRRVGCSKAAVDFWEATARIAIATLPESERRVIVGRCSEQAARELEEIPEWAQKLLEKHQWWKEAVDLAVAVSKKDLQIKYLIKAGRFLEAAHCSEELGNFQQAAEQFESACNYERAVSCVMRSEQPMEKRRLFVRQCAIASASAEKVFPPWAKILLEDRKWWEEATLVAAAAEKMELRRWYSAKYLQKKGLFEEAAKCITHRDIAESEQRHIVMECVLESVQQEAAKKATAAAKKKKKAETEEALKAAHTTYNTAVENAKELGMTTSLVEASPTDKTAAKEAVEDATKKLDDAKAADAKAAKELKESAPTWAMELLEKRKWWEEAVEVAGFLKETAPAWAIELRDKHEKEQKKQKNAQAKARKKKGKGGADESKHSAKTDGRKGDAEDSSG